MESMEILDLEELKENKSEVIDENLKGFMSKDEEVSKLLEDKIGEIDSETEKLNAKEEEIKDIIVTDLNSKDKTKEIIEKMAKDYEYLKVSNWKECKDIIDSIDNN